MMPDAKKNRLNFLIDYSDADLPWAEWIVRQLEDENYTVRYRERDFRPGTNFVQKTDQTIKMAEHTLIILSPDYLKARSENKTISGTPVWTSTFSKDSTGQKHKLVLVYVRKCRPGGFLENIVSINLVNTEEIEARNRLLNGVSVEPPSRPEKPVFPGSPKLATKENLSKPGFPLYRPSIWHVPDYNPFFTDREYVLAQIYSELKAGKKDGIHKHVINGLGGVGKTQVALAYAHKYNYLYKTVLWIDASTPHSLVSGIVDLANTLKLSLTKAERQNDQKVISTMRQWLEKYPNWLLILDNIEDLTAQDVIPSIGNGHILFTARMQATGTAASSTIHLDQLQQEDSALLLLRRARQINPDDTLEHVTDGVRTAAINLSSMLGNLPLMLDQAGAYMEEANIDVSGYLNRYTNTKLRHSLLQRRGDMARNHRESVAETWNHAFEIIQHTNPAAYDLLRFCAFLSPDEIPEEIITQGAAKLLPIFQSFADDPLQKDQAIITLRKHSLLNQNAPKRILTMNHMVQVVLRDKMSEEEHLQWIQHVITAMHYTLERIKLPDTNSPLAEYCPRYHPHVEACARHMKDQNVTSIEAARLLHRMGKYLHDYACYVSHDPSLPTQLEHTHIVSALENYAILLKQMQQLSEAEELVIYADNIRAVLAT